MLSVGRSITRSVSTAGPLSGWAEPAKDTSVMVSPGCTSTASPPATTAPPSVVTSAVAGSPPIAAVTSTVVLLIALTSTAAIPVGTNWELRVVSRIEAVVSSVPQLLTCRNRRPPSAAGSPGTTTCGPGGRAWGTQSAPAPVRPSVEVKVTAAATRPRSASTCTAKEPLSGAIRSRAKEIRRCAGTVIPRPGRSSTVPLPVRTLMLTMAGVSSGLDSTTVVSRPTAVEPPTNHDSVRGASHRSPASPRPEPLSARATCSTSSPAATGPEAVTTRASFCTALFNPGTTEPGPSSGTRDGAPVPDNGWLNTCPWSAGAAIPSGRGAEPTLTRVARTSLTCCTSGQTTRAPTTGTWWATGCWGAAG